MIQGSEGRLGFVALSGQARLKLEGLRYAVEEGLRAAKLSVAARQEAAADRLQARGEWRRRASARRLDFGPW